MEQKENEKTARPVMLNDGQRLLRINLQEVAYLEADRIYCKMHMSDGHTIHLINSPLGTVEGSLPADAFVRIHRSTIVNVWHISMVMGRLVWLTTGERLALGEKYTDALKDAFLIIGQKGK